MKRLLLATLGFLFLLSLKPAPAVAGRPADQSLDSGTLSVYFMGEKVGYEDYSWSADPRGYLLKASGRMTKPLQLEMGSMTLVLSRDFIPLEYSFQGSLNGMDQVITSKFLEGHVRNTVVVSGQETTSGTEIRRDALILPNPIFSPYLVLAKRFACGLKDKVEISAYMIPQVEIPGAIQSSTLNPCSLTLNLSGVEILLETDADHRLVSLSIPSQNLSVTLDR